MLTSKLIDIAFRKARLHNSNVYPHFYDLYNAVNMTYNQIYQTIISSGDKNFIKEIQVVNASKPVPMPSDFWKTQWVGFRTGNQETHINRLNGPEDSQGYDEYNFHWSFKGHFPGTVFIRYYKRPAEITFPNTPIQIDGPGAFESVNQILYCENKAISFLTDPVRESTISNIPPGGNWLATSGHGFYFYNNALYIFVKDQLKATLSLPPIDWIDTLSDDSVGLISFESTDGSRYCVSHDYQIIETDWLGNLIAGCRMRWQNGKLYVNDAEIATEGISNIIIRRPFTMLQYTNGRNKLQLTDKLLDWGLTANSDYWSPFADVGHWSFQQIIDYNPSLKHGYGTIVKANGEYYLAGSLPDTEIRYPNSLFDNYFIYLLANQMRIDAGEEIDNAWILNLQQLETQFRKSIKNDFYQNRIIQQYETTDWFEL